MFIFSVVSSSKHRCKSYTRTHIAQTIFDCVIAHLTQRRRVAPPTRLHPLIVAPVPHSLGLGPPLKNMVKPVKNQLSDIDLGHWVDIVSKNMVVRFFLCPEMSIRTNDQIVLGLFIVFGMLL